MMGALEAYARKFPAAGSSLGIYRSTRGGIRPSQLAQAARSQMMVTVKIA
jgi:hypothetical protein